MPETTTETKVACICITVSEFGAIQSIHANTEDVCILIRDMMAIERGQCDPLIGYALQAKENPSLCAYELAGYPVEIL